MKQLIRLYPCRASDTVIASRHESFIEGLQRVAMHMPGYEVVDSPERADVILIDELYGYRTWRYANTLASCPFVKRYCKRIVVLNHDDAARPFLPGLYVSLERSRPSLVPTRPIAYKRDLWLSRAPSAADLCKADLLWTFRGVTSRPPIRRNMWRALRHNSRGLFERLEKTLHEHNLRDQSLYIKSLTRGAFALAPRGLSPSTYRLFEAMQVGRCPVVISDDWIEPDGPDWRQCALRVKENQVSQLPAILEANESTAADRGREARAVWKANFSWPRRYVGFLEQVSKLIGHPDFGADDFGTMHDKWTSPKFLRRYQWTTMGRLRSRLARQAETIARIRFEREIGDTA